MPTNMSHRMTEQQSGMCGQRRLRSAWASALSDQSLLSAWRKLGFSATHWAHSEGSDQPGHPSSLIRVFAGRTVILLVLSWGGSYLQHCRGRGCTISLLVSHVMRKSMHSADNKSCASVDHSVHPQSRISTFLTGSIDSTLHIVAISEIPRL